VGAHCEFGHVNRVNTIDILLIQSFHKSLKGYWRSDIWVLRSRLGKPSHAAFFSVSPVELV
jgi:hypothetical protein